MIGIAEIRSGRRKTMYAQSDLSSWGPAVGSSDSNMTWTMSTTLSETPVWSSHTYVFEATRPLRSITHLRAVEADGRRVAFDKGLSLELQVTYDAGKVIVFDESFGLYGSGPTYARALADYSEFFIDFFEDITGAPKSELPASTLEYRRSLLTFGRLVRLG